MAEDKDDIMPKDEGEVLYEELSSEQPRRDIEGKEDKVSSGGSGGKGLADVLEDAPNLSDTQTIHNGLFPKDLGDPITNKLMIARIFPDCFVSLNRILVKRKVRMCDRRKPLDVAGFLTESYVLTTVGIEGKGRIDDLELAGSAREADEIDKMSRGLG